MKKKRGGLHGEKGGHNTKISVYSKKKGSLHGDRKGHNMNKISVYSEEEEGRSTWEERMVMT